MWWETLPAQIILWTGAVTALLLSLKRLWKGSEFLRRLLLHAAALGMTEEWPNGSTDLPSSLQVIYDKALENNRLIRNLRVDVQEHTGNHSMHNG